jgi:hypothetical protein
MTSRRTLLYEVGSVGGEVQIRFPRPYATLSLSCQRQQVGAPTVPSAFIARSWKWSQSRHISCHINLCKSGKLLAIHLIHVISCHFMSFIQIYVIHANSCHSCKFMSFMLIHVIRVNSCHSCFVSFAFSGNSVNSCHSCQFMSFMFCVICLFWKFRKVGGGREGGSNMSS